MFLISTALSRPVVRVFSPGVRNATSHDESKIILGRLLMPLPLQAVRIIGPLGLISLQDSVGTWVDLLSPLK